MKKKKFNLLLNIATLCLCVAAIAFGVYSAKNASLNVSGTVGFNAHNIDYTANVYMYGHSGADGKPVTEANKVTLTNTGSDKINFELGNQTFSDLGDSGNPETIYVVIEVTNNSDFNVALKANLSLCTTADANILIDTPKDDSARILASKTGTVDARKGTIKYTLNVKKNSNGEYPEIPTNNAVTLKVDLAKTDLTAGTTVRADLPVEIKEFTNPEKEAIKTGLGDAVVWTSIPYSDTILCYAERFPYYIEMGELDSTKIRWLIVGTSADNGTITTLLDEDRIALSKGLMLNKTYVMLSEKILLTDTDQSMSFQNKYTNSGDYLNDYGYSAQDYATSNIRQYLIGNTVKNASANYRPSGTDVNIMTKYNLNNDSMYANIKARSLTSIYNEVAISGETKDMLTVPTSKAGYTAVNFTGDTSDKLWLLSQTELEEIFKADYITGSREDYSSPIYMSSRTSVLNSTNANSWWLRSPYLKLAHCVCYVSIGSPLAEAVVQYNTNGVRPAFLF